jgi:hypothetical protein
MSFLNLGLGELMAIAGVLSAAVVALYLLDRSKRKIRVPTLRFWTHADVRTELTHRRRIQQPWSLVLQLASLILLLTAIAGPQFGVFDGNGRDHVIVLDTSAWMGSHAPRQGLLMDEARTAALAYLRTVPSRDRVMLVRADAVSTPATSFETNRGVVEEAIRQSRAGTSALNLDQALGYAQSAQKIQSRRAGEIVYIGANRVDEQSGADFTPPPNLRILPISAPLENVGLRKIGLRRSPTAPDKWEIFVAVRNFGVRPHDVDLGLQFAKSPAGSKRLSLKPGAEEQATFTYETKVAGYLEARLNIRDGFPDDDRALIELPAATTMKVAVYTNDPESLRALVSSNPQIDATFEPVAKYNPQVKADVVIVDGFAPAVPPQTNSLWIEPPAKGSPVPVAGVRKNVKISRWRTETSLGAGLRTSDEVIESAEIFAPEKGDIPVVDSEGGSLVVARGSEKKLAVLGFHPGKGTMKYQLAAPLLLANLLRWMAPDAFRRWEVQAAGVGTVNVPIEKGTNPASVHVVDESGKLLPFTMTDSTLQFFSGSEGTVRVAVGDREMVYSLALPDVAEATWKPPANVRRGIPRSSAGGSSNPPIWPWLAALGGIGLAVDWFLYGRSRMFRQWPQSPAAAVASPWRKAS